MGKDLRTTSTYLKLHRYPRVNMSLWGLQHPQPFFPPLEKLFKTETVASLKDYGVGLREEVAEVLAEDTIRTTKGTTASVHRKTTMILSPFKWMRGDYSGLGLPKPESVASDLQTTLQSPHTAGYVGALASLVLSESGCQHFPKVYGVYTALASKHTVDISDDYEDLSDRPWFTSNLGSTFELKLRHLEDGSPSFSHTRGQRPSVQLGDETVLDDIQDIDAEAVSEPGTRRSLSWSAPTQSDTEDSDYEEESEESDDEFEITSCDCSEASSEADDLEEDGDPFAWAIIKDAPVITTVMEQCTGTFYDLLEAHIQPERHAAWVAQIVFALAFAQRTYGFTHNDLHGNNVMYVPTEQEFLYYNHGGQCYRVPTYGVLIKLIDFDRACFSVRLQGMKDPRHFVSSQFRVDDEAAGQYNIEPFFIQTQPRIPLNPSFDLCRFATSVYWDLFPEGPDVPTGHPLQDVFQAWMTQTDGTSVLYRAKHRDQHDRYHGFDLYKAIARYCKDSATPRRELAKLLAFQCPTVPLGAACLLLEASA
jgi:hypothetical protein